MAFLPDITRHLENNSIGTLGTDLFMTVIPSTPDDVVVITQYAGRMPELYTNMDYPGLQVRVRAKEPDDAIAKIEEIETLLHGLANTTLGSTRVILSRAVQSHFPLGEDENGRHWEVQNYIIQRGK